MAQIYSNSLITLAASAGADSHHGLFSFADSSHIDCPLSDWTRCEDDSSIRMRHVVPHCSDQFPLMSRAWVYQERMLSPRFLHFGTQELIWECFQDSSCECSGWRPNEKTLWPNPKRILSPSTLEHPTFLGMEIVHQWRLAVVDYSTMQLTQESDILPALAGIANTIKNITNYTYLAGLWKESLVYDLCWQARLPQLSYRPKQWRAPTFSWASVVPKLGFKFHNATLWMEWETEHKLFQLTDAKLKHEGVSTTGRVLSEYIILRGIVAEVIITKSGGDSYGDAVWTVDFLSKSDLHSDSLFWPDYCFDVEGPHQVKSGDKMQCFKVLQQHNYEAVYLVLRETSDMLPTEAEDKRKEEVKTYERIGLLIISLHGPDKLEDFCPEAARQSERPQMETFKLI